MAWTQPPSLRPCWRPRLEAQAVRAAPARSRRCGQWPSRWLPALRSEALQSLHQSPLQPVQALTPLPPGLEFGRRRFQFGGQALLELADAFRSSKGLAALCGAQPCLVLAGAWRLSGSGMPGAESGSLGLSADGAAPQKAIPPLRRQAQLGFAYRAACSEPWSSL